MDMAMNDWGRELCVELGCGLWALWVEQEGWGLKADELGVGEKGDVGWAEVGVRVGVWFSSWKCCCWECCRERV